jgi:hypothetical protein
MRLADLYSFDAFAEKFPLFQPYAFIGKKAWLKINAGNFSKVRPLSENKLLKIHQILKTQGQATNFKTYTSLPVRIFCI